MFFPPGNHDFVDIRMRFPYRTFCKKSFHLAIKIFRRPPDPGRIPVQTIPQILDDVQKRYPQINAQYFRKTGAGPFVARAFAEFYQDALTFGAGLLSLGICRGEPVGLLADNRREWSVADIGIQACGACDVPRGRDITDAEIRIIFGTTKCRFVIVERGQELNRLVAAKDALPDLAALIIIDPAAPVPDAAGIAILSFDQVNEKGRQYRAEHPGAVEAAVAAGRKEDLATILFTSGTTGRPKGVMLTQENYLRHVSGGRERMMTEPGDVWLTMLPVWHSFERAVQYIALGNGVGLAYSKAVSMMKDFTEINPHYTTAVPRIWEMIYNSVQKKIDAAGGVKKKLFRFFVAVGGAYVVLDNLYKGLAPSFSKRSRAFDKIVSCLPRLLLMPLNAVGSRLVLQPIKALFGNRLKAGVSGGGSLQRKIDLFFASAGIVLMEGYGLTEAGPVVAVRSLRHLEAGTVGTAFPGMEIKLVDEEGRSCPPGAVGLIFARSDQIMKGYYEDPVETAKVLSPDGWLNTGDLGVLTHDGALAIVGRKKDTIVLLSGKNIEPAPIEKHLAYSPLIDTAVVVGQDQKHLGALIVPNIAFVRQYARENAIRDDSIEELVRNAAVLNLYREAIDGQVNARHGFQSYERIRAFALLTRPFEAPRELSAKQELKRAEVNRLYAREIAGLFR